MEPSTTTKKEENPLINILLNVLAPVLILGKMSNEGHELWHLGPKYAMYAALSLPLIYGIYYFIKNKKVNVFSVVGVLSVLLTGIITIVIWEYPSLRPQAPLLFGIKEAAQPLLLGSLFLLTHRTKTPLFKTFIFNDAIFNVDKIEKEIEAEGLTSNYQGLLWKSTLFFFFSFVISAVINLGVAFYFLQDLNPEAPNWDKEYNEGIAKIMGWGFLLIGAPLIIISCFIFYYLISGLKKLTHFKLEELLQPR